MKKTEKIEIRISHEDKERLTELAGHEGQSVSELIRGLARRYVDMNTSVVGKARPKWLLASAMMVGGALFGTWFGMHVLYPHFAHDHDDALGFVVAVKLTGGALGEQRLRTSMEIPFGEDVSTTSAALDSRYSIDASHDAEDQSISFRVCALGTQRCKDIVTSEIGRLTVLDGYLSDREAYTLSVARS